MDPLPILFYRPRLRNSSSSVMAILGSSSLLINASTNLNSKKLLDYRKRTFSARDGDDDDDDDDNNDFKNKIGASTNEENETTNEKSKQPLSLSSTKTKRQVVDEFIRRTDHRLQKIKVLQQSLPRKWELYVSAVEEYNRIIKSSLAFRQDQHKAALYLHDRTHELLAFLEFEFDIWFVATIEAYKVHKLYIGEIVKHIQAIEQSWRQNIQRPVQESNTSEEIPELITAVYTSFFNLWNQLRLYYTNMLPDAGDAISACNSCHDYKSRRQIQEKSASLTAALRQYDDRVERYPIMIRLQAPSAAQNETNAIVTASSSKFCRPFQSSSISSNNSLLSASSSSVVPHDQQPQQQQKQQYDGVEYCISCRA